MTQPKTGDLVKWYDKLRSQWRTGHVQSVAHTGEVRIRLSNGRVTALTPADKVTVVL
jgi:hypothetical protein